MKRTYSEVPIAGLVEKRRDRSQDYLVSLPDLSFTLDGEVGVLASVQQPLAGGGVEGCHRSDRSRTENSRVRLLYRKMESQRRGRRYGEMCCRSVGRDGNITTPRGLGFEGLNDAGAKTVMTRVLGVHLCSGDELTSILIRSIHIAAEELQGEGHMLNSLLQHPAVKCEVTVPDKDRLL